jgi:hypothetical protein
MTDTWGVGRRWWGLVRKAGGSPLIIGGRVAATEGNEPGPDAELAAETETTTNLIQPDECDEPFPIPALTRTYRVWVPFVDLAAPGGKTGVAVPHGATASVRFNALRAVQADTAAAVFGGVPLNALDTADDPRWAEPALVAIEVAGPVALVRDMSIDESGVPVAVDIGSEHVSELLESGSTRLTCVKTQFTADRRAAACWSEGRGGLNAA